MLNAEDQAEPYIEKPYTLPYEDDELEKLEYRFEELIQMAWDLNFRAEFLVETMHEMIEA